MSPMSATKKFQLGAALWGVLIGLGLALAIAACSSSGKAASRSPMPTGPTSDADHRQIELLHKEIRDWRIERKMSPDPTYDLKRHPDILQNSVAKIRQCPEQDEPPKTDVCTDVCSLRDDICDNAATICGIADKLGDDEWARGKCNSAKASCKEATEKCCDCQAGEKSASEQQPVDRSNAHF